MKLALLSTVFVALALTFGPSNRASAGPCEDGVAAYDKGDYATALRLWRPLAETANTKSEIEAAVEGATAFLNALVWPVFLAIALFWLKVPLRQIMVAVEKRIAEGADVALTRQGLELRSPKQSQAPILDAPEVANRPAAQAGREASDEARGLAAYQRDDYPTAHKLLAPLAESGRAAAQSALGYMYSTGLGVPQDYVQAAKWLRLAAAQNFATAQNNLGVMYETGRGVPQDAAEAATWYRKAADQGLPSAQVSIGACYAKGTGVPQDFAEAWKWIIKAAEQGHTLGQYDAGLFCENGWGTLQDLVRAHMWFNLATSTSSQAKDREDAAKARDRVATRMTPVQLAEAQKMAREWKAVTQG